MQITINKEAAESDALAFETNNHVCSPQVNRPTEYVWHVDGRVSIELTR